MLTKNFLYPSRHYIKSFIYFAAISLMVTYAYFQIRPAVRDSEFKIMSPKASVAVDKSPVIIYGIAKHAALITINGFQIYTDSSGYFKEKIFLSPGYNMITVAMRDKFDRVLIRQRPIVFTPSRL